MMSGSGSGGRLDKKNLTDAGPFRFGIVVSEWHQQITNVLFNCAVETLLKCGAKKENISSFYVPGSFELTAGANMLASTKKYDAIICLGCVIQGETRHFEFICNAVANGISHVSLTHICP